MMKPKLKEYDDLLGFVNFGLYIGDARARRITFRLCAAV
jgi:hypothetical protein